MSIAELSESTVNHHVDEMKRLGYTIMHDAIDDDLLNDILIELDRLNQVRPGGDIPPRPFSGFNTRRWFDLLNDGDVWQQVAIHPWIMQILPHLLGEGFLLSTMGSAVIGPGEQAQPIHVDDGVYRFRRPHPNLVCNTMWALCDFTEENGATRVVPESHLYERDPKDGQHYDSQPLVMPKGSIAFMIGTLYHGAGANQTQADREALTINYCNGCMRQQENLMLSIHPTKMLTFSPTLQNILGFQGCRGTGHIMAQDPGAEMKRRYSEGDIPDPDGEARNRRHRARLQKA